MGSKSNNAKTEDIPESLAGAVPAGPGSPWPPGKPVQRVPHVLSAGVVHQVGKELRHRPDDDGGCLGGLVHDRAEMAQVAGEKVSRPMAPPTGRSRHLQGVVRPGSDGKGPSKPS